MGENCSANSRLIVQENIKEALLDKMLAHLRDWKTGDPLDPSNYLGSLVDVEHFKKVCSYLDNDNIITGGVTESPCYVLPTIVDKVDPNSKLAQEEVFGPILSVITVKSFDEALPPYLQASMASWPTIASRRHSSASGSSESTRRATCGCNRSDACRRARSFELFKAGPEGCWRCSSTHTRCGSAVRAPLSL